MMMHSVLPMAEVRMEEVHGQVVSVITKERTMSLHLLKQPKKRIFLQQKI